MKSGTFRILWVRERHLRTLWSHYYAKSRTEYNYQHSSVCLGFCFLCLMWQLFGYFVFTFSSFQSSKLAVDIFRGYLPRDRSCNIYTKRRGPVKSSWEAGAVFTASSLPSRWLRVCAEQLWMYNSKSLRLKNLPGPPEYFWPIPLPVLDECFWMIKPHQESTMYTATTNCQFTEGPDKFCFCRISCCQVANSFQKDAGGWW